LGDVKSTHTVSIVGRWEFKTDAIELSNNLMIQGNTSVWSFRTFEKVLTKYIKNTMK
jgi:hypothetical protein